MYDGLKNLEVPRRTKHPRARRAARIGLVGVAVVALVVAGLGLYLYNYVEGKIDSAKDRDIETVVARQNDPINVLVLGSDRRDNLSKAELKSKPELRGPGGKRADTIMLFHISPHAERAVAISFPRDLRVEIPGHGHRKINSAYALGGPNLMIKTITAFSGIPIHHYVEINFNSFRSIINAVGGVEICTTRGYDDRKSGLRIPEAGCYVMKGDMALAYVRARNIDPRADLGRIERQQQFLRALMAQVRSAGFLLNPGKVTKLADAIGEGVVLSGEVDIRLARAIAGKLSGSQKNVDFRIVPGDPRYIGGVSYVIARTDEARRLFQAVIEDREKIPPVGKTSASVPRRKDVTVTVLNGTGKAGLAREEAAYLRDLGFVVSRVGNADPVEKTLVRFLPGAELKAQLIEEEYPGASIEVSTASRSTDIVVILGKDFLDARDELRGSPSPQT